MEKYEIRNRFTGALMVTAKIAATTDMTPSIKLGLAVKWAIKKRADLTGANLSEADLSEADLTGANLSGAYLSRANLSGAVLTEANLSRADLTGADLTGANLSGANLSGAYLSRANLSGAYLSRANLSGANLSRADLTGADLSRANLSRADLSRADLSRADLSRAVLSRAVLSRAVLSRAVLSRAVLTEANLSEAVLTGAYLSGADLSGAKNYIPEWTTPLASLPYMTGKIQAFKLVTQNGQSPIQYQGIAYPVGSIVEESDCDTDNNVQCGAGLNIADLPWVLKNWTRGHRILLVEHTAKDIAAIPYGTDGKYRVRKLKVVKDITEQLRASGALPA